MSLFWYFYEPEEEKQPKPTILVTKVDGKVIVKYLCQEIRTNFYHKDTLSMKYLNDHISLKNRFVDLGNGDILGGFRLYDNFKDTIDLLTEEAIMEEVIKAYKNKKPLSIEQCEYHFYY